MTVTIISRHSKTIHKLVEEQMKKEAQELGFDPWGDTAQEEFERRVTEMEKYLGKCSTSKTLISIYFEKCIISKKFICWTP